MTENQQSIYAGRITTVVSVLINTLLCIVKTSVGIISGSTALVADGIHSFADLISDFFTYAMLKISHEEADAEHPYGHGKFETFGTFALAVMLAITAIWIGYTALEKLLSGETTQLNQIALWAAAGSIVANEFLYHFCKYWGTKVNSKIILANAWHHRTDSLSSFAALAGVGLNMLGFVLADAIAALVVTAFLLNIAYRLGINAFHELVESAVEPELQKELLKVVKSASGVLGCHRLRARRLGNSILVDAHVDVANNISVTEGHGISENVEKALHANFPDIHDITIHIDPAKALSKPMPSKMHRKTLEPLVIDAIKKTMPTATLKHIVLHITKESQSADIIITGNPQGTEITALRNLLLDTQYFPFHCVNIYKEL